MPRSKKLVVTIDGPAGTGKSTVARLLARRLGLPWLDTGATYRCVALAALRQGVDPHDLEALAGVAGRVDVAFTPGDKRSGQRVTLDGEDVTEAVRTPEVTEATSFVADAPGVRAAMRALQQRLAERAGAVAEGRDMGTVVFPEADVKFFLDASPAERAGRRFKELLSRGIDVALDEVLGQIKRLDERDKSRPDGALRPAAGAVIVDTTDMSLDEVVETLGRAVDEKLG